MVLQTAQLSAFRVAGVFWASAAGLLGGVAGRSGGAAPISSTCQPMFLAAVSLEELVSRYFTTQLWSGFPECMVLEVISVAFQLWTQTIGSG